MLAPNRDRDYFLALKGRNDLVQEVPRDDELFSREMPVVPQRELRRSNCHILRLEAYLSIIEKNLEELEIVIDARRELSK